MTMEITYRTLFLHKAGNTQEEYEDAFWPNQEVNGKMASFRCAIADGATEASYSGIWAQQLVKAYCTEMLNSKNFAKHLLSLQKTWQETIDAIPLPWYAEEKVSKGAFATFLGLKLRHNKRDSTGKWEAMAIGDSCLFHIRNNRLIQAFPISEPDKFNSRPNLISTNFYSISTIDDHFQFASGDIEAGDSFYLMTDALACWFLQETSCITVQDWLFEKDFAHAITDLREGKRIVNDDITLTYINIESL